MAGFAHGDVLGFFNCRGTVTSRVYQHAQPVTNHDFVGKTKADSSQD